MIVLIKNMFHFSKEGRMNSERERERSVIRKTGRFLWRGNQIDEIEHFNK